MSSLNQQFQNYFSKANRSTGRLFFAAIIVGIVSGLGAILFFQLLGIVNHLCLQELAHYYPPEPVGEASGFESHGLPINRWWLLVLPAIGGLISGILVFTFAPEAEGHGTDAVIETFHYKKGIIRKRVPIIKALSSIITIGTGGSAGREGPIAQIGAGFGSYLASVLKMSDDERRTLMLAGVAGGIGGIFRSPLGGALFTIEVLYKRDFEAKSLIPALVASIVSYSVFASKFGWGLLFQTPTYQFNHPSELAFYALFGLVCAGVGIFYIKVFYGIRDYIFQPIQIKPHYKPAIGGLMIGMIGFFFPQVLASGYGYLQQAMNGELTIQFMLLAVFLKIIGTSFTISSGGSGGVFAPSLFIGGMLGGAFGQIMANAFPGIIEHPEAFVLVGMGAFFAGAAKVPVSSMIMVSEMTGGYSLLVPMMLSSSTASLAASRFNLYEKQVNRMADSPAHLGDFTIDVLDTMIVDQAYKASRSVPSISHTLKIADLKNIITNASESHFPVVNQNEEMIGIISLQNIRPLFFENEISPMLIAQDLMSPAVSVTPAENLKSALKKFIDNEYTQIPVVDFRDERKILGFLSHEDLIDAYNREIGKRKFADV